jgi:hypothetical protein
MAFACSVCGKEHDELPHIGADSPIYWSAAMKDGPRNLLTSDLCIIEEEDFFIRGVIEIPVSDYKDSFGWGVWISQKRENFDLYRQRPNDASIGPFTGWLSTQISYYSPSTVNLVTRAVFQGNGQRPRIELAECDHPLYRDYHSGISLAQAWEIVHNYM